MQSLYDIIASAAEFSDDDDGGRARIESEMREQIETADNEASE